MAGYEYDDDTGASTSTERDEVASTDAGATKGPQLNPGMGPLLDAPPPLACKRALRIWKSQDKAIKNRRARWKANRLRYRGIIGVQLIRPDKDRAEWGVHSPVAGTALPPNLNKARRLCRRLTSNLFVDPPIAECTPASDSDEDRAAAEFATRLLLELEGVKGVNNIKTAMQAFQLGSIYGSAFRYHDAHPHGAGHRPLQKRAGYDPRTGQQATTEAEADTNPQTGAPWPEYKLRYVGQGGALVDDPTQAQLEWLPRVQHQVRDARKIRLLPQGAESVDTAVGVAHGEFVTLGELRDRYAEALAALTPGQLRAMVSHRDVEEPTEYLVDQSDRTALDRQPKEADDTVDDRMLVWTLRITYKSHWAYPLGCCFAMAGKDVILEREPWMAKTSAGMEPLDLPYDQFKQFDEEEDTTYGLGAMDWLGDPNEMRGLLLGSFIEHIDRFNNRKVFLPVSSILQAKSARAATGTYIPINQGGEPKYEEVPDFPSIAEKLFDRITMEMDDDAGLSSTSQGEATPEVRSGLHAQQLIEQVAVGLSSMKHNTVSALERGYRIDLQLVKAKYTVEQELNFQNEEKEHQVQAFVGSDLESARDVQIAKGTMTMFSPSAKMAVSEQAAALGVITPYQLQRAFVGNSGGIIGAQDNEHWLRIRRQINRWKKGPSASAMQAFQGDPRPTGVVDPMGVPVPLVPPNGMPLGEEAAAVFDLRPNDTEPTIAPMRLEELSRVMSSTGYQKAHPAWRAPLDAEYVRMFQVVYPPAPAVGPDGKPLPPAEGAPPDGGGAPPAGAPGGYPTSATTDVPAQEKAPATAAVPSGLAA